MKRLLPPLLAAGALLSLTACGGGASSVMSNNPSGGPQTLSYRNPNNTSGQFALVLDTAATTSSALVLDLIGPETSPATPAVGVTFGFNVAASQATWAATPVINGNLFNLGAGVQLAQGWAQGGSLQGIVSNKGLGNQINDLGANQGMIGKIVLTPVQGGTSGPVALADNGLGTVLDASGTPYPVTFMVGTLTLN